MSHFKPQHPGCSEQPEKELHIVKPGSRGAYQTIDPRINSKSLTIGDDGDDSIRVSSPHRHPSNAELTKTYGLGDDGDDENGKKKKRLDEGE